MEGFGRFRGRFSGMGGRDLMDLWGGAARGLKIAGLGLAGR